MSQPASSLILSPLRRWRALALLAPLLLSVLALGYAVRLPFYLDDGLLFTMIRDYPPELSPLGTAGLRFWGGSPSFPYYRPLPFSLWELDYADGAFDAAFWHWANVLLYGLGGVGVAALGRRLSGRLSVGLLAGLWFVAFPFNFNMVLWVASLFHSLALVGVVLGVLAGLRWLEQGRGGALALALGCAFIALFSHENGVLLLPLLVGAAWLRLGWRGLFTRRAWAAWLCLGAISGVYLLLWLGLPRPAAGPTTLQGGMIPGSAAIFMQGLGMVGAALVRAFMQADARTLPLLALGAGALALALAWAWPRWKLVAFGFGWCVLAALPTVLLLPTDYLRGSVRLLALSSVGMALVWGAALARWPLRGSWRARVASVLALAWLIAGFGISAAYWGARRDEALRQADYLRALRVLIEQDTPADERPGEGVVLVNAPAFLARHNHERLFLTTSEALMFMEGSYTHFDQVLWAMTGRDYGRIEGVVVAEWFNAPSSYVYAPYWNSTPADVGAHLAQARRVYVTRFQGDDFAPQRWTP